MAAVERLARQEQTGRSQQLWDEAHPEQPHRNLYYEQPDEGGNVDSGIPTDKDRYSELDLQDQKEFPDLSATDRWQTGHADARQSYDIRKRLIGCAGGGAVIISVRKEYGDRWSLFHKNSQIG